jgi:hypothetical protein
LSSSSVKLVTYERNFFVLIGNGTDAQKNTLLEYAKSLRPQQSDGIPYKTHLQVGGEYFISTNIDLQDGLYNGSTGGLKMIEYGQTRHQQRVPIAAWMDFRNPLVGVCKRSLTKRYQQRHNINLQWTRIERIRRNLSKTGRQKGLELIRTQIPLVAANAMTITKSQGSSLPFVIVSVERYRTKAGNLTRKLTRESLYVACSRATSLQGLFVDGAFEPPASPGPRDLVSLEMARLRKSTFPFSMKFLQDYNDGFIKILFNNVQSFQLHQADVIADHCAMSRYGNFYSAEDKN